MGALAADVAGRMAFNGVRQWGQGQRPSARDLLMTPANMRRMADELARMRGAAMKIGQLVSMDTGDILPPELADILARLRADADFMPPKQLRDVLDGAWGNGWRRQFARFDVRPMAAASIGQVHRALLPDGTALAIKVQYPGIGRSIDSDVANIARLIRLSGLLPEGFALDPYLEEARRQLREETDYRAEATHLTRFRALLEGDKRFTLPKVHAPLSCENVLAMTFVPSAAIETVAAQPQRERDRVAHALCDLMLRELFCFGVMQTDPNFANYRYDPQTGQIVLLDFGATRSVPAEVPAQMRALLRAGLAGDRDAVAEVAEEMQLLPVETPEVFKAPILGMIMTVFEEITAAPVMNLSVSTLARRLQQQGEALAQAGFVPHPMPMDLVFVQRKIAGMFLLATRLGARLPVAELVATHVAPT